MRTNRLLVTRVAAAWTFATLLYSAQESIAQDGFSMGFFITSSGLGNGADLGGLAGADAHCQSLAAAVGSGDRTWRAYLSAQATDAQMAVNARDRIGPGPWYNALGVIIANDVDELHGANNLTKQTAVNEQGEIVNGRGDSPNRHDMLTGSQLDGTVVPGDADSTCSNWTSSGVGSAMLGHHDRQGGGDNPTSWNSAHASRGCSQSNLRSTGGDGLFYCFAVDRLPLLIPLDNGTLSDPSERSNYVHDVLSTWIGDANLDGEFNSDDLVNVLAAGTYETEADASWISGDFDGSGRFDSGDLVVALADGGYESGPRAAVSAVPEPTTWASLLTAFLVIGSRLRFHRTALAEISGRRAPR